MRRGAFPRELSDIERKAIQHIYQEARELTIGTGIEHHVDHIKPIALGGDHHPDNLQILTARENLSKGSKWNAKHLPGSPYYSDKLKLPLQLGIEFDDLDVEIPEDIGD